jgi:hypothetical protein
MHEHEPANMLAILGFFNNGLVTTGVTGRRLKLGVEALKLLYNPLLCDPFDPQSF